MKNLKENLQAITKELKTLMGKVEQLGKALDKAAKAAISSKTTKKKAAPKAAAKKTPAKKKSASKKPAKKAAASAAATGPTAIDTVVDIIKKSKNGVDVETLIKKTGYDTKKISNLVYKAKKRGDIKSGAKGIYVKK
jgi:phage protein D